MKKKKLSESKDIMAKAWKFAVRPYREFFNQKRLIRGLDVKKKGDEFLNKILLPLDKKGYIPAKWKPQIDDLYNLNPMTTSPGVSQYGFALLTNQLDKLLTSLSENVIKEHSQTFDVDGAGQLWPFAEKKSYAKSWESARMANLFKGSLKDMMLVKGGDLDSITNDSDEEDYRNRERGGDSYDTYDMPKHVLGDYSVTKIMYDKGEVDMYADDVPTIDSKDLED